MLFPLLLLLLLPRSLLACLFPPCQVYLKLEFSQFTGSFKERGARNALMCLSPVRDGTGAIFSSCMGFRRRLPSLSRSSSLVPLGFLAYRNLKLSLFTSPPPPFHRIYYELTSHFHCIP